MTIVVIGDLHLHAGAHLASSREFVRVVDGYLAGPPVCLVLCGDVYDLAVEGAGPVAERLAKIDAYHAGFHDALARLVAAGSTVVLVPGNHDYELNSLEGRRFFETRVPGASVASWFYRVEGVHIEHGNQYDPDNCHPHPLAAAGDPLGIMLTRRILHRLGDLHLLRFNDQTPLPVLLQSFLAYGLRTPELVARYVWNGLRQLVAAGRGRAEAEGRGRALETEVAALRGLTTQEIRGLAALSAQPTHVRPFAIFRRLYLDRIAAALGLGTAAVLTLAGVLELGAMSLGLLGATAIALSLFLPNRYEGRVDDALEAAASRIRALTGASQVVFGHTHAPRAQPGYSNTGSFGMPKRGEARSFLEIEAGVARHCRLPVLDRAGLSVEGSDPAPWTTSSIHHHR